MSQLRFAFLLSDVDMGCGVEEDSIDRADLLGDVVRSDGWFSGSDYPNEVTPFADYLCKLAEDLEIEGIVDFSPAAPPDVISTVGYFTIWGAEPHRVCGNELAELSGDSRLARWALACGDVQLSRVPKEFLEPAAKNTRVQWLESQLSDETRGRCEK